MIEALACSRLVSVFLFFEPVFLFRNFFIEFAHVCIRVVLRVRSGHSKIKKILPPLIVLLAQKFFAPISTIVFQNFFSLALTEIQFIITLYIQFKQL